MSAGLYPLRSLLLSVSGWLHREQRRTIEQLVEENQVLKEQLSGRKLRGEGVRTLDIQLGKRARLGGAARSKL